MGNSHYKSNILGLTGAEKIASFVSVGCTTGAFTTVNCTTASLTNAKVQPSGGITFGRNYAGIFSGTVTSGNAASIEAAAVTYFGVVSGTLTKGAMYFSPTGGIFVRITAASWPQLGKIY